MSKLRILMLSTHFHPVRGGSENQALLLAHELQRRGHKVHVLTMARDASAREESVGGIEVHRRLKPWGPGPIWRWTYYRQSLGEIERLAPEVDVIHSHHLFLHTFAALDATPARPMLCKPACSGPYGDLERLRQIAPKYLTRLPAVDRYIAVTDEVGGELSGAGVPAERIERLPNMVDTVAIQPPHASEPRAEELLVFVGRLEPKKNLATLLEAFAPIGRLREGLVLKLVGEGSEREAIRARARELGLARQVDLAGQVTDPVPYLQYATMVVHPSLGEGMSNAILEATAAGAPIVASDIPANREALSADGERAGERTAEAMEALPGTSVRYEITPCGILVPPTDAGAFGEAIKFLLNNAEIRAELGHAARRVAERRYAAGKLVDRYEEIYRELMAAG